MDIQMVARKRNTPGKGSSVFTGVRVGEGRYIEHCWSDADLKRDATVSNLWQPPQ